MDKAHWPGLWSLFKPVALEHSGEQALVLANPFLNYSNAF